MKKMWVNQPSNQQDWHHRHGENVLVDAEGFCHFANGHKVKIPMTVLSNGHRYPDTARRQIALEGRLQEWKIGCQYLQAAGVTRLPGKPTLSDIPRMLTPDEEAQTKREEERWTQLLSGRAGCE